MTGSKRPQSKFVEAISQIQELIKTNQFQSGDKLPSERELSERLAIGRSSIREALRALELLGLIETKRGEGTFLRDFKDHQLVPLIGAFILDDDQNKEHVRDIKAILELGCLAILAKQFTAGEMEETISGKELSFHKLMDTAGNRLLKKIWLIISDYADSCSDDKRLLDLLFAVKQIHHSRGQ